MATNTYVALYSNTLTTSTATVTISAIPQTYTNLKLVITAKNLTGNSDVLMRFNSDSASNYSATIVGGDGSSTYTNRRTNATSIVCNYFNFLNSTDATQFNIHIAGYNNATTIKPVLIRANRASQAVEMITAPWRATPAAITQIDLTLSSSSFAAGSTFTIYGVAAEPQATAKATGGTITYGVEYTYHTFTSSGTFTPSQNLTCDYLVVGGGGGGGIDFGGGGGAGGYRTASSVAFTTASHTVTVGGPGVGGNRSNGSIGGTGTASSISGGSLTTFSAAGGGGGGAIFADPTNGGSGGGGWGGYANMVGTVVGQGNTPSTTPSQGNNGGLGYAPSGYGSNRYGGGGGGATAVGSNATSGSFGIGGAGATTTFSGSSVTYARGGNGCESQSFSGAASGAANTGNGGQGGGENNAGGSGGSGIVIIRYAK